MKEDVAMQVRCVHCLREQYVMAVIDVSLGTGPCAWCGMTSESMTDREYRRRIAERRQDRGRP